jgi:hypothetical protein
MLRPLCAVAALLAGSSLYFFGCSSDGSDGLRADGSSDPSCASSATCASASSIGTVSGDTDAGTLTASGTTSTWLQMRVTEDDSNWAGRPTEFTASVTSPPGTTFDLFAYVYTATALPDGGDFSDAGPPVDCTNLVASSTRAGDVATVHVAWGEALDGGSANGLDDSRVVSLQVRNTAGKCSGTPWSLVVRGNP